MPVTLAAQDVENIDSFFQKAFKVIFKSGMMAGLGKVTSTEFDCVGFNHGLWLPLESVSLWLGCHTNDSVRKEWETKGVKVLKASNRLAKMYKHLDGISAELRASDRAGDLLKARFTILERRLIEFRYLWWNLKKSLNISADNRADEDGDGLFESDRILVWGGVRFTLRTNQAIVFRLLVDAYPGDVTHGVFCEKGIGELRDSFRFNNAQRKKEYYPCWGLIADGSVKDSKRLIDPSIVRSDQEKFSDPRHNPQRSPG